ncbi:hypothetical protein EfsSVR2331_17290 [Enterococcus faecalis]|nr:hypothetical protein EfsSVR2331_17290 [Enterococcus faecalis]
MSKKGSDIIVESLINHEVPYIFGIPGAKIDGVFDALVDKGPELILARHEQNACLYGTRDWSFDGRAWLSYCN